MVEAEFLFELLESLLTDRARLDHRSERPKIGVSWEVGQIEFLLAGRAPIAAEPEFVTRKVLHAIVADTLSRPVSDAQAGGAKLAFSGPSFPCTKRAWAISH